jgi:hypothetical protein
LIGEKLGTPAPRMLCAAVLAVWMAVPGLWADRSDSITLEILGKSSITAGIAYEREVTNFLTLGGGFGINGISKVDFLYEGATYRAIDLSVPANLYGILTLAGDRNRLILPFGVVVFTEFSIHRFRRFLEANPTPFLGLGYEIRGKRLTFRIPVYVAYLGEPSELLPGIMPWAGLSLGYRF